jgi:hypothetical protein
VADPKDAGKTLRTVFEDGREGLAHTCSDLGIYITLMAFSRVRGGILDT